jgi:hypothetical protein
MASRTVSEHPAWPARVRLGLARYEWLDRHRATSGPGPSPIRTQVSSGPVLIPASAPAPTSLPVLSYLRLTIGHGPTVREIGWRPCPGQINGCTSNVMSGLLVFEFSLKASVHNGSQYYISMYIANWLLCALIELPKA